MTRKTAPGQLAYFGGTPLFEKPQAVGYPNQVDRAEFFSRVEDIFDRNWLTNNGPCVRELETKLAEYLDVPECILTANGTLGLELVIKALGLTGEVILPAMTFVATAHALEWCGLTPVFADIDSKTHSLDPEDVRRKITPRTSGILGVHLWGRPCDVTQLQQTAHETGIKLFFDAAHAFGSSFNDHLVGSYGEAEVFSFHATKVFHTMEGGAITTRNPALAERLRRIRNFGFVGQDSVAELGINAKMNEVCAAFGLTLLPHVSELIEGNRRVYRRYQSLIQNIPHLHFVDVDDQQETNCQYVVLETDAEIDRDLVVEILRCENILARCYFYPGCHRMPPYAHRLSNPAMALPHTDALLKRVLCLPAGAHMPDADVDTLCKILALAVEAALFSEETSTRQRIT